MKISIITVCYNSEDTIERTIKSVISQKYSDLEYIVIDGGSTDQTVQIVRKYESYMSYWVSEPDDGIYDAMNKGIAVATGEVIAFLNSDDWYAEDTLNHVARYFAETDADIVSGNLFRVKDGKVTVTPRASQEDMDAYFFYMMLPHPGLFARVSLFDKYGMFDTQYKISADYDWILRVYLAGCKIKVVEDCFTYFSYGGISIVRKSEAVKEQQKSAVFHMKQCKKFYLEERIETYYESLQKMIKTKESYEYALQYKTEAVRKLFELGKKYYIWGTGVRGKKCLELFEYLNVSIKGFIDSNKRQETVNGYPVIFPDEIDDDSNICITPKDYSEEIIAQLSDFGVKKERFFTYEELLDTIANLGQVENDE